jgi:hypothetical protein
MSKVTEAEDTDPSDFAGFVYMGLVRLTEPRGAALPVFA